LRIPSAHLSQASPNRPPPSRYAMWIHAFTSIPPPPPITQSTTHGACRSGLPPLRFHPMGPLPVSHKHPRPIGVAFDSEGISLTLARIKRLTSRPFLTPKIFGVLSEIQSLSPPFCFVTRLIPFFSTPYFSSGLFPDFSVEGGSSILLNFGCFRR